MRFPESVDATIEPAIIQTELLVAEDFPKLTEAAKKRRQKAAVL